MLIIPMGRLNGPKLLNILSGFLLINHISGIRFLMCQALFRVIGRGKPLKRKIIIHQFVSQQFFLPAACVSATVFPTAGSAFNGAG